MVLLLATVLIPAFTAFAEPSILERERARRSARTVEAQEQLKLGDAAYESGDFQKAVESYGIARSALSESAMTGELRAAATQRYAQAAVQRARQLAKDGDRLAAEGLLDNVLDPEMLPSYAPALQLREQIFDPIRNNPALTPEHVREVDEVRRTLYEAEGYFNLGQYDRALAMYEEVLRIDATNTAARRGMEKIHRYRAGHYMAAYDEARSRMMTSVDKMWETSVPPLESTLGGGLGLLVEEHNLGRTAEAKLRTTIVPSVDLSNVGLVEAVDFLRQTSVDLDTVELDDNQRGVSFVIDLGTGESDVAKTVLSKRFNLNLRNVPLAKIMEYIELATGTKSRIDEHAVVILPEGFESSDMITRTWKVPPDFLSRESINQQQDADNPFDVNQGGRALLVTSLTAEEFLKKQGVSFPDGATAAFVPGSSTLRVRNTPSNIDYVDQVVSSIVENEPVVVAIEVRFVTTTYDLLEELGYDWIVSGFGLNDDVYLGGGSTGNGTPFQDYQGTGVHPVTAGNRSGRAASNNNTIDAVLNRDRSGGGQSESAVRGPGVLSLVGAWNDEQVGVLMRGLNNHKGDDWMVKKSVVTRSGQTAIIESTSDIIVPTEYEPPQLPSNVGGTTFTDLTTGETASSGMSFATPATPTAFETRKTGCILEVEPLVGPNRQYVELSLKPEVRELDGFIDYGTPITGGSTSIGVNPAGIGNALIPSFTQTGNFGEVTANSILMPVFSVTRTNANLIVADGATIVMGGLLTESRLKFQDKVPVLGDIPWIGRFFQSEAESNLRSALVIFVKVRLMDPSGQPYRER